MANPVVVVPVHKAAPTPAEEVSLLQLQKTIKRTPILLLAPASLQTDHYSRLLPGSNILRVEPYRMASIRAYNQMLVSPFLYNKLADYSHMLIHEPDALVFRDELDYWCHQPYDYIGAPWISIGPADEVQIHPFHINGGLSLSRIAAMRRATSSWKRWHGLHVKRDFLAGLLGDFTRLKRALLVVYPGGLLRGAHLLYPWNWDKFFYETVATLLPDFRLAPPEARLRFSWEFGCHACMQLNNGQLPFGLHAWKKYDFDFLRPHLLAAGVDLSPLAPG